MTGRMPCFVGKAQPVADTGGENWPPPDSTHSILVRIYSVPLCVAPGPGHQRPRLLVAPAPPRRAFTLVSALAAAWRTIMRPVVSRKTDQSDYVSLASRKRRRHCVVTAFAMAVGVLGFPAVGESARFTCTNGDTACLIAAINAANANGRRNTIVLGPGIYSLETVDNEGAEGPNGLPVITSNLRIVGESAATTIIERASIFSTGSFFRIIEVAESGSLLIEKVTIRDGILVLTVGVGPGEISWRTGRWR